MLAAAAEDLPASQSMQTIAASVEYVPESEKMTTRGCGLRG
jgi:hypothetical protein